MLFPSDVTTNIYPPPPDYIYEGIHHGIHGDLPVLRKLCSPKMHDLVMGSPAFPSVRDIPLAMMGYDVDYLTVEAFDVGGRNFDTTLVGLYYFAIREDDGVLRAADHIIACGEALRQLVQTRRLAEGMGRAI